MIISEIYLDQQVFILSQINLTSHMQDFIQEFTFKVQNQCSVSKKQLLIKNRNSSIQESRTKIEPQRDSDIYSCTGSSITFYFKLKNLLKLQIRSKPEKSTDPIYETVMTNQTLPESLKKRLGSVDEIFTHFEFDAKQSECKFIQNQKEAKLIFNDDKNHLFQIIFLPLTKGQDVQEPKEKNGLEKLLERQSQMREIISKLQEGQNKMNQSLGQKDKQIISLTEQKAKADQELALKTELLQEARKKQVQISFRKHPKFGKFIHYQEQGKMTLKMMGQNVTDQMVKEIAQCDLSRIQILSMGSNEITDYGFDLLFQNRQWPVLQQIYLQCNKIQNIHSLHKISNLRRLCIYNNELSFASCNYMCEHQLPELIRLRISFKKGLNDKCWGRLLTAMQEKFPQMDFLNYLISKPMRGMQETTTEKFPKLKFLCYSLKKDISKENKEKIQKYCQDRSIILQQNH